MNLKDFNGFRQDLFRPLFVCLLVNVILIHADTSNCSDIPRFNETIECFGNMQHNSELPTCSQGMKMINCLDDKLNNTGGDCLKSFFSNLPNCLCFLDDVELDSQCSLPQYNITKSTCIEKTDNFKAGDSVCCIERNSILPTSDNCKAGERLDNKIHDFCNISNLEECRHACIGGQCTQDSDKYLPACCYPVGNKNKDTLHGGVVVLIIIVSITCGVICTFGVMHRLRQKNVLQPPNTIRRSAQASESEIVDVTGIQELIQDTSHEYNIFSDKFENGQSREVFAYVNPEYELHAVDRETVQDTEENLEDVKSKVQEENVGHRRRKVCQSPFEIQIEMTEQDFTKTDSTKYLKRQTTRVCPSPFEIQDEMEDTVSNEDIAGLQELNRSATYEFELPRDSCENGQIKDINPKYEMYSFKQETKKCEENLEQCGNNACEPPVENRNEIGVQDLTRSDNTCSEVLHQMTRVCPSPFEIPE